MTPSFQQVYSALFQDVVVWGLAAIGLGVVAAGARWILRLLSSG